MHLEIGLYLGLKGGGEWGGNRMYSFLAGRLASLVILEAYKPHFMA